MNHSSCESLEEFNERWKTSPAGIEHYRKENLKTKCRLVESSPFGGSYAGLILVESLSGDKYLEMGQESGVDDVWGPLTDKQVEAFYILSDAKDVTKEIQLNRISDKDFDKIKMEMNAQAAVASLPTTETERTKKTL